MVRDPVVEGDAPVLQDVLDALDDPDCRTILRTLDEPMTAKEISETCDVPLSTTYRKVELLSDARLVDERTELRQDGHHTTRYVRDFDTVLVEFDEEDDELTATIARRPETADERLATLWSNIREEV